MASMFCRRLRRSSCSRMDSAGQCLPVVITRLCGTSVKTQRMMSYIPKVNVPHDTQRMWQTYRGFCTSARTGTSGRKKRILDQHETLTSETSQANLDMIKNHLNLSETRAQELMKKCRKLATIDKENLERNIRTLQRYKIFATDELKCMKLLSQCPVLLENKVAILDELGMTNLTVQQLSDFSLLFRRTSISTLKDQNLLPVDYDPWEQVLAPLGLSAQLPSSDYLPSRLSTFTLSQVQKELGENFHCYCFEWPKWKVQSASKISSNKSITLQHQVLHQLFHRWHYDLEKVRQNNFILNYSPVNMDHIWTEVPEILGTSIRDIVLYCGSVLSRPYHKLLQVSHVLEKLSDCQLDPRSFYVLTLHPETIEERIRHLKQIPALAPTLNSSRGLELLVCYHKVMERMSLLPRENEDTWVLPSISTLVGPDYKFDKFITQGSSRICRLEIVNSLSCFFNIDETEIKQSIHPNCWTVETNLFMIHKNLDTLTKAGFTKEQILSAVNIVMYPPNLLSDTLEQLPSRPEAQIVTGSSDDPRFLQLLHYIMDKEVGYFSEK